MQRFSMDLLKKNDVWNQNVTPTSTLYSVINSSELRTSDELRRFKTAIASLCKEPFWDNDTRQSTDFSYFLDGVGIWGSSSAEACERDKIIVSFLSSSSSLDPLNIIRNGINVPLKNLLSAGPLTEHLWQDGNISFESYLKSKYSRGKLDFSRVSDNMGFSNIPTTEQSLFIDTFRKFEESTWDQIYSDSGLKYTEYHGVIDQRLRGQKTYKFRASQKIRCHGYRENNLFIVIGFEIDHQLSDRG